jgi:hypothetical protein
MLEKNRSADCGAGVKSLSMISRRVYQHVKDHNWFAVAIDVVVVVVGVFIGLQVSNWNAERRAEQAARTYIERMREDIAFSVRSTQSTLEYYQTVKIHALAALEGFEKPQEELGEQFLIDAFLAGPSTAPPSAQPLTRSYRQGIELDTESRGSQADRYLLQGRGSDRAVAANPYTVRR